MAFPFLHLTFYTLPEWKQRYMLGKNEDGGVSCHFNIMTLRGGPICIGKIK